MESSIRQDLTGTCAFRLMPDDDLVSGPSAASVTRLGAEAVSLDYRWQHPSDGEQHGSVLIGGSDAGRVAAVLFDTWHQQPGFMQLSGERRGDRVELSGSYAEDWGWTVLVDLGGDVTRMTMQNVVPESAVAALPPGSPPMSAGPYDVMVAEWGPPTSTMPRPSTLPTLAPRPER